MKTIKKFAGFLTILSMICLFGCQPESTQNTDQVVTPKTPKVAPAKNDAHQLIRDMIAKVGTMDDLKEMKDVQYTYTYKKSEEAKDVSMERYVFDGELSWALYSVHMASLMPGQGGKIVQGYDGENSWMTIDGELTTDPKMIKQADFSRKTNFYWLTMMQKLDDPGLKYEMLDKKDINGVMHDVVKVTFGDGVGDAQDDYVLAINPKTNLVDEFTFTVRDFGMESPLLMRVKYTDHGDVKLPTYRKYLKLDDEGNYNDADWIEEICEDLTFGNRFDQSLFKAPK